MILDMYNIPWTLKWLGLKKGIPLSQRKYVVDMLFDADILRFQEDTG